MGPYVVESKTDNQVELRTTAAVEGQQSEKFTMRLDRVARCTTETDVCEDLRKQASLLRH